MPCVYAICAIRTKKLEPALFCDDYLMPSTYLDSYNPIIFPIAGEDDWEQIDYPIAPPPYKKQAGRPKMKRIREPDERKPPPAPNTTRMPRTYVKMTCQVCKNKGHNRLGCPITKATKATQAVRPCFNLLRVLCFLLCDWIEMSNILFNLYREKAVPMVAKLLERG